MVTIFRECINIFIQQTHILIRPRRALPFRRSMKNRGRISYASETGGYGGGRVVTGGAPRMDRSLRSGASRRESLNKGALKASEG